MKTTCWVLLALIIGAFSVSTAAQQRMSDKDVEAIMKNLSQDAKTYRKAFDSAIQKSAVRKTSQEKDGKALAQQFQRQADAMLNEFKKSRKADASLPLVLSTADKLEKAAGNAGVASQLSTNWAPIRANLDKLSAEFNMPKSS